MAFSTHTKSVTTFNAGNNPVAFQLTETDNMKPIPQTTSTDEVVVKIWQCQMLIPFVVTGKLVAFHGPYPDNQIQPKTIQTHFSSYTPSLPLAFEKDGTIDIKFMDPKARVFKSMPTPGNKEYVAWLNKVQRKLQDQWRNVGIFDAI